MGEETKYDAMRAYNKLCEEIRISQDLLDQMYRIREALEKHMEKDFDIRRQDLWKIYKK